MRVLEYIYDHDEGSRGGAPIAGLRELVGEDEAATSAVALLGRGLVRREQRLSGGYHISSEGRIEVEAIRARRRDRGHRRALCREDLLRWVDQNTTTDAGSRVGREDFDGAADLIRFTDDEVVAAAAHLAENGLIKSISAAGALHILVWITEKGRECVDEGQGIPAFLTKDNRAESQVFHVSGSGNSIAAAVGNHNHVTASLSAFDAEIADQFAAAVRQSLSVLNLPIEAEAALDDIEQREDPHRAQRGTAVLYALVMGTATGTLGQVLGVLGGQALGIGS